MDDGRLRYCRPVTLGNWRIVPLDSRVAGRVGGFVGEGQLERLRNEIATADNVLVLLHHHPLPSGSRWLDGIGLDNADELVAMVEDSDNVRGVIWGHVHQHYEARRGPALFASTPSTCAQFLPDSETFALDRRSPAYRTLTLSPDGGLETEVVWVTESGGA